MPTANPAIASGLSRKPEAAAAPQVKVWLLNGWLSLHLQ